MWVINGLLNFITYSLYWILPKLGLTTAEILNFDTAALTIVSMINAAGYLVPLGTLAACITTILVFNNWKFLWSIGFKIISLIRG